LSPDRDGVADAHSSDGDGVVDITDILMLVYKYCFFVETKLDQLPCPMETNWKRWRSCLSTRVMTVFRNSKQAPPIDAASYVENTKTPFTICNSSIKATGPAAVHSSPRVMQQGDLKRLTPRIPLGQVSQTRQWVLFPLYPGGVPCKSAAMGEANNLPSSLITFPSFAVAL
jgi:hypothetical protein